MIEFMDMKPFKFTLSLYLTVFSLFAHAQLTEQSELYYGEYRVSKTSQVENDTNSNLLTQDEQIGILQARLDSVIAELINLKDETRRLKQENGTLLGDSKEANQKNEEQRKIETLSTSTPAGFASTKSADYGGYNSCLECTSYQPLFSEKITFHFTLNPKSDTFKGVFRFSYAPEFGQRESRNQQVSGQYVETKEDIIFQIDKIDHVKTDVKLILNERSYKSSFKAGPNASVLPYTKVTYFEDMTIYKCLF